MHGYMLHISISIRIESGETVKKVDVGCSRAQLLLEAAESCAANGFQLRGPFPQPCSQLCLGNVAEQQRLCSSAPDVPSHHGTTQSLLAHIPTTPSSHWCVGAIHVMPATLEYLSPCILGVVREILQAEQVVRQLQECAGLQGSKQSAPSGQLSSSHVSGAIEYVPCHQVAE
jgi:hypothetical protein